MRQAIIAGALLMIGVDTSNAVDQIKLGGGLVPLGLATYLAQPSNSPAVIDPRMAQVLAEALVERNVTRVAVTYSDTPYGRSLFQSFIATYKQRGASVETIVAHRDDQSDYFAEVGELAAAAAEHLVIFGYADLGGGKIVRAALDTGSFEKFVFGDAMINDSLVGEVGAALEGSIAIVKTPGPINEDGSAETMQLSADSGSQGALPELNDVTDSQVAAGKAPIDLPVSEMSGQQELLKVIEFKNGKFETIKVR